MHGLVAATHTPFQADGAVALSVVEKQAEHLLRNRVRFAFVGGSTGESHSLSVEERRALTQRWCEVARGTDLKVVVHVGSNCLPDAGALASHAERSGAIAISALAPSYFKPRSPEILIEWCRTIAAAAPQTPFYYYDIPVMTGVAFAMPEFMEKAARQIPTLAGLKFSNPDLMAYLHLLQAEAGRWDVPWGIDEALLSALASGGRGAVGSSYNFAAPISHEIMEALSRGDLPAARAAQMRSTKVIGLLARYGYMAAAKATMEFLGVPVGAPRLPHAPLTPEQKQSLERELQALGFFAWVA